MISFRNIGGLGRFGNQMFQFASTVGIARSLGYDPVFPLENFNLNGDPDSYNGCKLRECFDIPSSMLRDSSSIGIRHIYQETGFTYNPQTEKLPPNTDISGYFQTEKYFSRIGSEIMDLFKFKESIVNKANTIAKIEDGVSLHVRRGDYLSYPLHHPTQSLEYYDAAMNEFQEDSKFYVFSDDIEWCKNNIKGKNVSFIESGSPYVDLYLMTQCNGHIIANSSFSWWGAWLAKDTKKVVAPSKWFGPAINHSTTDLYCKNWKII